MSFDFTTVNVRRLILISGSQFALFYKPANIAFDGAAPVAYFYNLGPLDLANAIFPTHDDAVAAYETAGAAQVVVNVDSSFGSGHTLGWIQDDGTDKLVNRADASDISLGTLSSGVSALQTSAGVLSSSIVTLSSASVTQANAINSLNTNLTSGAVATAISSLNTAIGLKLAATAINSNAYVANAPADATTDYNVVTTLLGAVTTGLNTTNTKQNDIAAKLNSVIAALKTVGILKTTP